MYAEEGQLVTTVEQATSALDKWKWAAQINVKEILLVF
jgi:hypothetical protein